jgi:hypothetical protein
LVDAGFRIFLHQPTANICSMAMGVHAEGKGMQLNWLVHCAGHFQLL